MNQSASDVLDIVKDATKFKARLEQLVKAEKDSGIAVAAAKDKALGIVAVARDIETEAQDKLGQAKQRLKAAKAAEDDNAAVLLTAQETEQKAVARQNRLDKNQDKLDQDRAILDRHICEHDERVIAFNNKAKSYLAAIKAAYENT